jgi:hypothetical protein
MFLFFSHQLNNPKQAARGYQNSAMRFVLKASTPECFNRGSRSGLAWIPDRSIRE